MNGSYGPGNSKMVGWIKFKSFNRPVSLVKGHGINTKYGPRFGTCHGPSANFLNRPRGNQTRTDPSSQRKKEKNCEHYQKPKYSKYTYSKICYQKQRQNRSRNYQTYIDHKKEELSIRNN